MYFSASLLQRKFTVLNKDLWGTQGQVVSRMLVRAQFSKIVNYYAAKLPKDVSLDKLEGKVLDMRTASGSKSQWFARIDERGTWRLDNLKLTDMPYYGFGNPFELYVGCNGSLLTIDQVSKVFGIPAMTIVALKLLLIRDEAVLENLLSRYITR